MAWRKIVLCRAGWHPWRPVGGRAAMVSGKCVVCGAEGPVDDQGNLYKVPTHPKWALYLVVVFPLSFPAFPVVLCLVAVAVFGLKA